MSFHYTPYTLLSLVSTFISLALAGFAWRRRSASGARPFIAVVFSVALWSFAYAFELASADLPTAMFWIKLQYFGIVTLPVAWMLTTLEYTDRDQWLTWRRLLPVLAVPFVTLCLALTNEYHHLIWRTTVLETGGDFAVFRPTYGTWFWVHTGYSYAANLIGTLVLIQAYYRVPALYRKQALALMIGAIMPWIGNILYLLQISPIPHLDLTPFSFMISGTLIAFGVLRFQLLDIGPVAHDLVVKSMSDGVIVLDKRHRIVDINPVASKAFGIEATEAYGKPITYIMRDRLDIIDRYRTTTHVHDELVIERNGEQHYVDVQVSPIYNNTSHLAGRLIVWRDITERKRAEAEQLRQQRLLEALMIELRSAKESAEAASRAKSAFLAHMSHELRTPLSAMLGYTDLLQRELRQLGQTRLIADTERINAAGMHLLDLMNTVLDFSKVEANKMELQRHVVDIEAFFADVSNAFRPLVEQRGNTWSADCSVDINMMCTDVVKLRQILLNLLSNANKFTDNGTITLEVREEHQVPHDASSEHSDAIQPPSAARIVIFEVSDTGIGIKPEHINQLFQEFTQVADTSKRFYGGTGLGLALCRQLCQLMGGDISVASTYGYGSTFTVRLPDLAATRLTLLESQPDSTMPMSLHERELMQSGE